MSYKVYKVYPIQKVTRLLLAFCFICFALHSRGQNVEFIKKNFKDNTKGFKKAMDSIKKGDTYYAKGLYYYRYAVRYYMSAEKFNPNSAMLNYKLGKCMIYSPLKGQAATYLLKAISLNPSMNSDVHYYLARAYHLNMEWEKAKQEYSNYLQTLSPDKTAAISDSRKKIEECNNGEHLCLSPVRVYIDDLGTSINTKYQEYRPLVTVDESELIFTSRIDITKGHKTDIKDAQTYEDVFVSYYKNGTWGPDTKLGAKIDTKSHDATAGLSPDGQTLYIYRTKDGGDLYQSKLTNNQWTKPKRMNNKINSVGKESSITVSPDGKVCYFVSSRPGGYGMGDIYTATLDAKGRWSNPQNLGSGVNSQYDEQGVFLDGNTLYFSSTGHNTMGGYDIFKTSFENGQWTTPANLGYPINTPDDDAFFVIPSNKKHAYYSSCQKSGYGEMDLYMITFLGPEKPVAVSTAPATLAGIANVPDVMMSVTSVNKAVLKGIVVDSETHKPLFASLLLVDDKKNKIMASFNTDSVTGRFEVSLPLGINYAIAAKANNYLFYSGNVNLIDSSHSREVEKDIALQPLNVGSHVALRNIFFDFDRATLRKESAPELQEVIDLLKQYPTVHIEISGYTDSKGGAAYNINLSAARAKSVVTYLVAHGIAANRLTSKGYGAANPVATNATDAGRQLNRRTEFKITSK